MKRVIMFGRGNSPELNRKVTNIKEMIGEHDLTVAYDQ